MLVLHGYLLRASLNQGETQQKKSFDRLPRWRSLLNFGRDWAVISTFTFRSNNGKFFPSLSLCTMETEMHEYNYFADREKKNN